VVESNKRALNAMAEGMKGLLYGDNSGGRQRKHRARVRATLANCQHVGVGRGVPKEEVGWCVGVSRSYVEGQRTELNSVRRRVCSFPLGGRLLCGGKRRCADRG
jgi:hypothetical protein